MSSSSEGQGFGLRVQVVGFGPSGFEDEVFHVPCCNSFHVPRCNTFHSTCCVRARGNAYSRNRATEVVVYCMNLSRAAFLVLHGMKIYFSWY